MLHGITMPDGLENVKIIEIHGANQEPVTDEVYLTTCRGLVMDGTKMLISHEENVDCYSIPGGGLEYGETFEECCVREIGEETGYAVKLTQPFLTIHEYYGRYLLIHHYHLCEAVGTTKRQPTASEIERGLVPKWMEFEDILAVFARHNDWAETNEARCGMYLREYTALKEYLSQM